MTWITNSRIIASCAVVLLHVSADVIEQTPFGERHWWQGNFFDSMVRWGVPLFVVISGALLLDPNKNESLIQFYRKRLSRILIPLVFWSIFYSAWAGFRFLLKGEEFTTWTILSKILRGTPHYHLWYLYMILGLYLFTPFIRTLVLNSTRKELYFFVVLTFFISALNYLTIGLTSGSSILFLNWFLSYIPYFILGYIIQTDKNCYPVTKLLGVLVFCLLLTFFGPYFVAKSSNLSMGLYFYGYLSFNVILISICVAYLFKRLEKPIFGAKLTYELGNLTFGVYLIHPIFLETSNALKIGPIDNRGVLSIPAITTVILFFSFLSSWGISKIPHIKKIL